MVDVSYLGIPNLLLSVTWTWNLRDGHLSQKSETGRQLSLPSPDNFHLQPTPFRLQLTFKLRLSLH